MAWYEVKKGGGSPSPSPVYESFICNIGQCAFNSGHIHTANTKIKFKAVIESWRYSYEWQVAFGAVNNNYQSNALLFWGRTGNGQTKMGFGRTGAYSEGENVDAPESSTSANWVFVPCVFTAEGQTISWYREGDMNTVRHLTASGTVDGGIAPLAIFNYNKSTEADGWTIVNDATAYMKLYWFEIYESDVLVHRFVPAYNNNQWCLYDEIDDTYIYDTIDNGSKLRGWLAS